MKKSLFLLPVILLFIMLTGISNAQTFETFLNAGSSTVQAGLDVNHKLDQGSLRTGLSGIYYKHDTEKFKILEGHMAVGNDLKVGGFSGELGIKGLVGSAEKKLETGDLGSLGFMVGGSYQLPSNVLPLTTKVFAGLSWSPSPLAFMDLDRYFDMKVGLDVYLVEKAAMEFSFQRYDIEMKNGPRNWSREDNLVTIGIRLKF
jgi:hypothetical protein